MYLKCVINDEILELDTNCKINNQSIEEFLIGINNDLNNISNDFVNIEFNGIINGNCGKHYFQIHKLYLFTNSFTRES